MTGFICPDGEGVTAMDLDPDNSDDKKEEVRSMLGDRAAELVEETDE